MTAAPLPSQPERSLMAQAASGAKRVKRVRTRTGWIVAIVFAFVYALAAFAGLSTLIAITQAFAEKEIDLPTNGLLALIGLVAAPVVVYALALWGTRRVGTGSSCVVFIVGFAVASVLNLDLSSLYQSIVPFVIPV